MSNTLNIEPPSSSTPRVGDTELVTEARYPTRLRRTVVADDTSTHESQSQASQSARTPKRKSTSARSKSRRNTLSRKREAKPRMTESSIIKWAEEESRTHPQSVSELGQILMSIAQTSPAAQVKEEEHGVESINWQDVARAVVEESKPESEMRMLNPKKSQKRHQEFSNPDCKPKTIVKSMIQHDDDDSPLIEDLPAEDETPDKTKPSETSELKVDKTKTLLERQQSSDEKLESFQEASSFLNSDIDSDFGKELSQEFKTLNVPISVPLSRVYSAHEPSSPEIDIENPIATPPPSVAMKVEPTPVISSIKVHDTATRPNTDTVQQNMNSDEPKLQNRLVQHIRPNPLLARWTLHKNIQHQ